MNNLVFHCWNSWFNEKRTQGKKYKEIVYYLQIIWLQPYVFSNNTVGWILFDRDSNYPPPDEKSTTLITWLLRLYTNFKLMQLLTRTVVFIWFYRKDTNEETPVWRKARLKFKTQVLSEVGIVSYRNHQFYIPKT